MGCNILKSYIIEYVTLDGIIKEKIQAESESNAITIFNKKNSFMSHKIKNIIEYKEEK